MDQLLRKERPSDMRLSLQEGKASVCCDVYDITRKLGVCVCPDVGSGTFDVSLVSVPA